MIKKNKIKIVVVLDNIRSMHNIGSIFRTCDALGVSSIILCGICAVPPNKEIHKTALGATESVPWKYFKKTHEAIMYLKNKNYEIVSMEQTEHSTSLTDFKPIDHNVALVLGNEVKGVDLEIINMSNSIIEIKQYGVKKSINVGIAAGIALWSILNKN